MTDHDDETARDRAIRRTTHLRTGLIAGAVVTSLSVAGGLALAEAHTSGNATDSATSSTGSTGSNTNSSSSQNLATSGSTSSDSSATTAGS